MANKDTIIEILPEEVPQSLEKEAIVTVSEQDASTTSNPSKARRVIRGLRGSRRTSSGFREGAAIESYDGEEDTVNSLGKVYDAVLNFHKVTRYAVYILPVSLLLAIPLIIFATVAKDARAGGCRLLGLFVWIQICWSALWVSKLVSQLLPYVFRFLCGFISSGTRKYYMVLRALEIPLSLVFWTIISYATIPIISAWDKPRTFAWVHTLGRVFLASIAVSCIFLAEKTIVQIISISYHRKQFNARIRASKRSVRMLDILYDASRRLFPAYCAEFINEDYVILTGVEQSQDPQAAANLRVLGNLGWVRDGVTTAFGNMASEITGQHVFDPTAAHNMVVEALESVAASTALAQRLWMSFVEKDCDALKPKDIAEVLPPERRKEAEGIFEILDVDNNGDVSLDEMVMTVVEIGRERKDMSRSMHDVNQAVKIFDRFLMVLTLGFVGVVYAAFFSQSFAHYLATIGTQIAAVSFALAGTAQEFLGSCIFLFVKHPYDVGDRVRINDVDLEVKHISLLYTIFRRFDTNRVLQIPNIVSNGLWVENISRSKAMKEQVTVLIAPGTSFEDIEIFRHELQMFVRQPANKRDFLPTIDVEIMNVGDMSKLELRIEATHKSNWSNEALRQSRRNKLMTAVISIMRSVPIYSPGADAAGQGTASMPNHTIVTTPEAIAAAKREFEQNKLAKRMYPVGYRPPQVDAPNEIQHAGQEPGDEDKATATGFETSANQGSLQVTGRRVGVAAGNVTSRSSIDSQNGVDVLDFHDHRTGHGVR